MNYAAFVQRENEIKDQRSPALRVEDHFKSITLFKGYLLKTYVQNTTKYKYFVTCICHKFIVTTHSEDLVRGMLL